MAAVASAQSGAWNVATTWVGGIIPVAGDTVTTSGTHAITVPDGYTAACATLSQSFTAGTLALDLQAGATLHIGADTDTVYTQTGWQITPSASTAVVAVKVQGQLFLHQGVTQGLCTVQFYGGCLVEGSRAAAHATAIGWRVGNAAQTTNANARIEHVNNFTAIPVTVQGSVGTGANPSTQAGPYFYGGSTTGCGLVWVDGTGVSSSRYYRCGGGATPVFNDGPFSTTTQKVVKRNAVFDGCGQVLANALSIPAANDFLLENLTIRNSTTAVNDYCLNVISTSTMTTGRRLLRRLRVDRKITNTCKGISLTDIGWDIPHGGALQIQYLVTASASGPPALAEKLFIHSGDSFNGGQTVTWPYGSVIDRIYYLGNTCSNPHPNQFGLNQASAASTTTTVTRALTQVYGNGNDTGDSWQVSSNPANVQQVVMRNCIQLPNGTTKTLKSMKFSAVAGNCPNARMTYEHNTIFTGGGGAETGIQIGETQSASTPGVILSIRSNISHGVGAANTFRYLLMRLQGTFQDHVAASNVDYNAFWQNDNDGVNPTGMGTQLANSGSLWSTGSTGFGPSNIYGQDPTYLDTRLRDIGVLYNDTFGTSLAAIDALRAGVAEVMKANDASGFNPAFNIDTLIDWVMAGYAPQNVALQAAHDAGAPLTPAGQWIGAVAGSPPAGSGGGGAYYQTKLRQAA